MKDSLLMLSIKVRNLLTKEEGQDLIEYALLAAIIALGATVGMGNVATEINAAFNAVSSTLATAV